MKKILILIMLIITSMLFSTTYTVKQDGTGDFTTIQAAIDFVVDDDVIEVYEGTYNELINFLGKNILVKANSAIVENTIISDSSSNTYGVVNFILGESYAEINGFTIQDGVMGIKVGPQGSPIIQNCKIQYNDDGIYIRGNSASPDICNNEISNNSSSGIVCYEDTYPNIYSNFINNNTKGIYANGGIIQPSECNPIIYDNNIFSNDYGIKSINAEINILDCSIYANNVDGITNEMSIFNIMNCEIYNNDDMGINNFLSSGTISDCSIYDNDHHGISNFDGAMNYVNDCDIYNNGASAIQNNLTSNVVIENCNIFDNYNGIVDLTTSTYHYVLIKIIDCVIYDNHNYGIRLANSASIVTTTLTQNLVAIKFFIPMPTNNEVLISNSILWDNGITFENYNPSITTISYSDLPLTVGTNNINEDPLFEEPLNYEFSLSWTETQKSPCINTGDPSSPSDPDGSRVDMGAYYKDHDMKTYEFEGINGAHDGWTWLSFDILDIFEAATTNRIDELWGPIENSIDYGLQEETNFSYSYPNWQNGDYEVISPDGFKVKMESESDQIEVSGFRCKYTTIFPVLAEMPVGNWIGYFLENSQHVYDAFADHLDNIYLIQTQHWSVSSPWPDISNTLNPGDMVVVWCVRDIPNFSWANNTPSEPFIIEEPQSFSYTEEADYIPIYIDLDPENMPEEIGVLLDGECKGATVVQDTLANICAYITGSQGGTLEFEFSYGSRGVNTNYKEYLVYEPETGYRETTKIDLKDKQECYYVSFRGDQSDNLPVKLSTSNYPNPFNPTTTIAYSLPDDGMVEIGIYNIKGQLVKTLVKGEQLAGSYETVWNGKDSNEKSVSSGIYFYKLSTKDDTIMKKMLMLK
ncbi:MAG: right-handed parallel beta-helix repeat-containing protein [Candidatus Cloacimonadota bacterium]|nr:right-handed parallel beta-helix repeat-containing protein [Candidatus Cloacimonadota bacterium]